METIGSKLERAGKIQFWVILAASLIGGIVSWVMFAETIGFWIGIISFLLSVLLGGFVAWVTKLLLFAFASLVDDTHFIASTIEQPKGEKQFTAAESNSAAAESNAAENQVDDNDEFVQPLPFDKGYVRCPKCNTVNQESMKKCYRCGVRFQ